MLVAVEGIDRAGKGTHAKKLAEKLRAVHMKYPARHTPIGRLIDGWLKGGIALGQHIGVSDFWAASKKDDALMGQALLLANKIEVQQSLARALRENGRVVSDRYTPSAFAYGAADGLDRDWLVAAHAGLIQPDLCLLLDISVEESMKRMGRPDDEAYDRDFDRVKAARDHYLDIAEHGSDVPGPWVILDATKPVEVVEAEIARAIRDTFGIRV